MHCYSTAENGHIALLYIVTRHSILEQYWLLWQQSLLYMIKQHRCIWSNKTVLYGHITLLIWLKSTAIYINIYSTYTVMLPYTIMWPYTVYKICTLVYGLIALLYMVISTACLCSHSSAVYGHLICSHRTALYDHSIAV